MNKVSEIEQEASYGVQEVVGLARVNGPIVVVQGVRGARYDEIVDVIGSDGESRVGRVLEVGEETAVIEVFSSTTGLRREDTRVRFTGRSLRIPVSREMLGRVFDGLGRPMDGQPPPLAESWADVNGQPINPTARIYPHDAIQTGLSALDGMNTLVMGQKLPIFSGSGLPHDELAAQIVRQATLVNAERKEDTSFAVVFAALGVKHDVAEFFQRSLARTGALNRAALFLNLADDPSVERIITPRAALTLAEYLAFKRGLHVLVILTDMTNYCEALRQISSAHNEIPSRKGYPGYLYSDLASLYERTGRIKGAEGSITQVPILTMPNGDITHPVPDLTGYITEGQIVLSRELHQKDIYPPIDVPPSLSRLMKDSIGESYTRADHKAVSTQLYAAYARVKDVRSLASVIGEEELSQVDQAYMRFGHAFETYFIGQGQNEDRSVDRTLDLGWQVLSMLPRDELTRISEALLDDYYRPDQTADDFEAEREVVR